MDSLQNHTQNKGKKESRHAYNLNKNRTHNFEITHIFSWWCISKDLAWIAINESKSLGHFPVHCWISCVVLLYTCTTQQRTAHSVQRVSVNVTTSAWWAPAPSFWTKSSTPRWWRCGGDAAGLTILISFSILGLPSHSSWNPNPNPNLSWVQVSADVANTGAN